MLYIRGMTDADTMTVFDRRTVRARRDRAAARWPEHDFLKREVAERLADRLSDIRRTFPRALDLGCHGGEMADLIRGRAGVEWVARADLSPAMAARAGGPALAADEEFLPFADGSFDLVTSCLSLHWVNDVPGALIQVRRALRPDGLFLGAMLGGETLFELRRCLMEAETELLGGLSPRVSPMAEVRDAGGLLQRAGFALPVVDSDTITVGYPSALRLMRDLRGMAETNAVIQRRRQVPPRTLFALAAQRYEQLYAEADGTVSATFQVLYMAGWAPAEGQQKPLRPGSAAHRLAEALGTTERSTGVKPGG
ncbi:MAG TPA: methyltransferase domain-containing protein [Azospirillaceae bacterium]|nr:methyltransferase domain-containing protein [Azospirillaceae bacterium]